ncbi:hypothetical protein AYI68_g2778 [Smittium mucronatum]|uniref:Uncharacterized protein n=1 Tax=Smittium mucronatum TaxID=133383 RepID=A0A1R0H1S6_9FUNG|nr:hypothetical protein AYI68_g2778 [Smittium mucronatum]
MFSEAHTLLPHPAENLEHLYLLYYSYSHFDASPCTDNTKFLYSPHGKNNIQEPYRGVGPELNEISSKEETISSIADSPSKSTNGSKHFLNSNASIEIDSEASLSLSYTTSRQATTFGGNK